MRTQDVIRHFGGVTAAARALGVTRDAVYKWGDTVPRLRACEIQLRTGGRLTVDPACYPHAPPKANGRAHRV